jgi:hypothetical protein
VSFAQAAKAFRDPKEDQNHLAARRATKMSKTTTIARMRRNGRLVGVKPDGTEEVLDTQPTGLAPMSAAEIEAAAARDHENPPLSDARPGQLRPVPRVKTLRRAHALRPQNVVSTRHLGVSLYPAPPKLRMNLIKSKQRIADHGEVFTPVWMVDAMLDLVKEESERIDSRFLEPACGSGNFLVRVLQRKLAAVELKFGKSEFDKKQYGLMGLMCTYGIELLADNIAECRANMLEVFAGYLNLNETDELYLAAFYVLSQNIVHGDALTMRMHDGQPLTFAEWGYLGKGKFQRRDFRLDTLTQMSSFSQEGSLFAHLGKHEIFTPIKTYPPMTARELACSSSDNGLEKFV